MRRQCAYCGAASETRDHVPPKGVFASPFPSDMITVPACRPCHATTSKDDVHFRDVLLSAAQLEHEPRAMRAREAVLRSLARSEQERYSATYVKTMVDVDVVSPGGIWIARHPGIPLTPRIGRVVARIARGLYWREFGTPLPPTHEIKAAHLDQKGRYVRSIADRGIRIREKPVVACGGQFAYVFVMTQAPVGAWIGTFYDRVWAVALIAAAA